MIKKLNKEELIELVKLICNANFDNEHEYDYALELFMINVPDPEASDLIFYHKPKLTPEEIVEKALSYKPLITPPLLKKTK